MNCDNDKEYAKNKTKKSGVIKSLFMRAKNSFTSPSKLESDAMPVSLVNGTAISPMLNTQSNDIQRRDPWQIAERQPTTVASSSSPPFLSPNINQLLASQNFNANSLSVTHVETQNNYNFERATNLHIGNTILVRSSNNKRKTSEERGQNLSSTADDGSPKFTMTETIKELINSGDPLDVKYLQIISRHMSSEWRFFLSLLGYSRAEMDQMLEKYQTVGPNEVIFRFLHDWDQNNDEACVGKLCRMLWENDQQEAVKRLRLHVKQMRKSNTLSSSNSGDDGKRDNPEQPIESS